MNQAFADTVYWIALANPNDQWHAAAHQLSRKLSPFRLVTTDEVLVEFLAYFAKRDLLRVSASALARQILANPNIRVIPQTRASFLAGLELYEKRPDKGYSLTDCISMVTMRTEGLTDILTGDHHFEQEGYQILFKSDR